MEFLDLARLIMIGEKMQHYPKFVMELIAYAQKTLPNDDFNDVKFERVSKDEFHFSNIKDRAGNERRLIVRKREIGDPDVTDADTGQRYWIK